MKLMDVVALTHDVPGKGLFRGQVGTAIEDLGGGVFEVEFADLEGRAYAFAPLTDQDVLILHHEPLQEPA